MSDIRDYQVDHLLLLVGSNPVPNAVAGKLLTTTADTITLIHSDDGLDLVQRLKSWFVHAGYSDTNIGFKQVEESNAASVYACVHEVLEGYESKVLKEYKSDSDNANKARLVRMGLNYTGGTKVMSVHAYRALKIWAEDDSRDAIFSRNPVFSYLDARTLRMRFDPARGRPAISFYVGLEVDTSIRDLLELHNWEPIKAPITVPVLPESAAALLAVHSNPTDARRWTEWLRNELFGNARKRVAIRPPFWVSQSGKELQEQYDVKQPGDKWKSQTDLRKLAISWPALSALRETMSKELGQHGVEYLNLTAATGRGCKDEKEFCKWLSGTWLESAVLSALQDCPQELHLKECCMDIKPKVPGSSTPGELFQFDVAAIRGYQLFAFACTTEGGGKGLLKQKLFEAYVRTRQMSGDEACAALVCCTTQETADELEAEMRRDIILEGRIRVFGRDHLANLARHMEDWIREQSRDPEQSKED